MKEPFTLLFLWIKYDKVPFVAYADENTDSRGVTVPVCDQKTLDKSAETNDNKHRPLNCSADPRQRRQSLFTASSDSADPSGSDADACVSVQRVSSAAAGVDEWIRVGQRRTD